LQKRERIFSTSLGTGNYRRILRDAHGGPHGKPAMVTAANPNTVADSFGIITGAPLDEGMRALRAGGGDYFT
jgi:hypothetical protein